MRRLLLLPALLLAACGGAAAPSGDVSPALAELHLVEDHPQISAAVFPHAAHTQQTDEGRRATCLRCHHELADAPSAIPRACRDCHGFAYLAEPVDESQPHDHDQPPDL